MRQWMCLVLVVLCAAQAHAKPADEVGAVVAWHDSPDAALRARAFDVLLRHGEPTRLADAALGKPNGDPATPAVREAYRGARYLLALADRLRAAPAGGAARYLALEEALRSPWAAHVEVVLERAKL